MTRGKREQAVWDALAARIRDRQLIDKAQKMLVKYPCLTLRGAVIEASQDRYAQAQDTAQAAKSAQAQEASASR